MIPDAYFDRFETQKYRSKNPVQRMLIRRFAATLHSMFLEALPARTVLEVGCGEGFLSGYLSEKLEDTSFVGVEYNPDDVARLRRHFPRIEAHEGSIYDLGFLKKKPDVVVCCEVLEHLDDPRKALAELRKVGARRALLSVPHEPFFMLSNLLRGKNVSRFGNDIDHKNHWGTGSFRALLEPDFEVLEVRTSYPWILALAEPRP